MIVRGRIYERTPPAVEGGSDGGYARVVKKGRELETTCW